MRKGAFTECRCQKTLNSEFHQFIGTSRSGKNTKIHVIVDGLGNSVSFLLSGGEIHDSKMVIALLETVNIPGSHILADLMYDSEEICSHIVRRGTTYVIPSKHNTKQP